MSNLDRLVDEILSQAQAEVDELLAKGKKEAEAIKAQGLVDAAKVAEEVTRQAQQQAQQDQARIKAKAVREATGQILEAKAKVIAEVSARIAKEIPKMNSASYAMLMKNLLLKAVQTGDEIVSWASGETTLGQRLTNEVNAQLKRAGKSGELTIGEPLAAKVTGGFILRGSNYEVNATTEVLVDIFCEENEDQLAKILFAN